MKRKLLKETKKAKWITGIIVVKHLILFALIGLGACGEDSNGSSAEEEKDSPTEATVINVDYKKANNVVYYNATTGDTVIRAYNAWDVAFSNDAKNPVILVNGGAQGSWNSLRLTDSEDISADFSQLKDSIQSMYDTEVEKGLFNGKVVLLKNSAGNRWKVQVKSYGPMGMATLAYAKLGEEAQELSIKLDTDYDAIYLNLEQGKAVEVAPKTTDWTLRFGRTQQWVKEAPPGFNLQAQSAVALNTAAGIEVAQISKNIEDITGAESAEFSGDILAIGSKWYTYEVGDNHSYTFEIAKETSWLIKNSEGKKFAIQMLSFYGPNNEQFYATLKEKRDF